MRKNGCNEYYGHDFSTVTDYYMQKVLYFNIHFKLKMLWNSITNWIHVLRVAKPYNVMLCIQFLHFYFCLLNSLISKLEVKILCSPGFNFLLQTFTYKFQTFTLSSFCLTYFPLVLSLFMLWYESTCSFRCASVIHHCPSNLLTTSSMTSAFVLSLNSLLRHYLFSLQCRRSKQANLLHHLSDSNQCLNNLLSFNCQVTIYLAK